MNSVKSVLERKLAQKVIQIYNPMKNSPTPAKYWI